MWQTFFSDVSDITISGLAGTAYIDKTDAALRKPQTTELVTSPQRQEARRQSHRQGYLRPNRVRSGLVWEFFCQVVFWLLAVPCLERKGRSSSRRLRSGSRSARRGVKGPKC
jgi:hypothetical protein